MHNSKEDLIANTALLHIPKTGGTSLLSAIQKSGHAISHLDSALYFDLRHVTPKFRLISGHLPLYTFGQEPICRDIITVLREPKARVISFLNHVKSDENHPAHAMIQGGLVSPIELFDQRPFSIEMKNLQTRMLGMTPDRSLLRRANAGDVRANYECISQYLTEPLTERHLEFAINNINEKINASVYEILAFSCWTTFAHILPMAHRDLPRLRVPKSHIAESEELIERISHENNFDAILYRNAHELSVEKASNYMLSQNNILALPGAPYAFKGLYYNELYQRNLLRWTNGHANISIYTPKRLRRVRFELEIWQLGSFSGDEIVVSVGGHQIAAAAGSAGLRWDAILESKPEKAGFRIDIQIESSTRQYGIDSRILGVPLKLLKVSEA